MHLNEHNFLSSEGVIKRINLLIPVFFFFNQSQEIML